MPELPEVETIRLQLSKLIVGKKILDILTDTPKMVLPTLTKVKKEIVGKKIVKIGRRAKLLQIVLSNKKILVIHLKMTGRLLVRKKGFKKDDWQHVTIKLKNQNSKSKSKDLELRFCDLRKFGWMKLIDNAKFKVQSDFFKNLGPEFIVTEGSKGVVLTLKQFEKIASKTRRNIKTVLMDQSKLSGVGNIYACDALNLSKIDPRRAANSLSREEIKRLFTAVKKVLKAGLKYGGASDNDYLDAFGKKGKYQEHFLVYNRVGKNCFNCKGEIMKMKISGRGTYYCGNCQK